jgi:AraC-type DNA-binding domain-containing proteins
MFFHKRKPAPPLGDYVEYLWYLADTPAHAQERIVPTGTFELVINLAEDGFSIGEQPSGPAGATRRPRGAVVSGPFRRFLLVDTRDHASIVGVHFRPGRVLPFLGCRADEIGAGHVELEDLWGAADARRLRERLCAAATTDQRLRVLEDALTARLACRTAELLSLRRDIHYAVQALQCGTAPISQIAADLGLSHRRFIEVFTAQVGTTPKFYGRLQRFHRALRVATDAAGAGAGRGPNWGALALECGYFDQSHLVRDFREFAGLTPERLVRHARAAPVKDGHVAVAP